MKAEPLGRLRWAPVVIPGVVGIGLLALAWQLIAAHNPGLLPGLGAVLSELWHKPRWYVSHLGATLREMAIGAGASFGVAFLLAVAMCHVRFVERAVMPIAVVLNVTPIVAITPSLAVFFGVGSLPKYLVTGIIVFFPLLVNCLIGLRSVDPRALEVFRSLHASTLEILWRLRLPNSLPFVFAGLRIALPLSIVGAVVAEFLVSGTQSGLGGLIQVGESYGNQPQVYAATLVIAAVGIVLTIAVIACERSLLSWHPSMEGTK